MSSMIVFGDSIAKGVGDPDGGWVQRLVDARSNLKITNLAEDGERVEGTLAKVMVSGAGELAVIATGTNDCGLISNKEKGEAIQPDAKAFTEGYEKLIEAAKQKFERVIALGLTPSNGIIMPLDGAIVSYNNETISEFNSVVAKLCADSGIDFVDLLPHFLGHEKELLADHIHPNSSGYDIIAKNVDKILD